MAASDFVTESQVDSLVTAIAAEFNGGGSVGPAYVVENDIGANASAARTAGVGQIQHWICDAGVTPINAVTGDWQTNRA